MRADPSARPLLTPTEGVLLEALRLWCAGLRSQDYTPWGDAWSLLAQVFGPSAGRAALSEIEAVAACVRPQVAKPPNCAALSTFEDGFVALMRAETFRDARAVASRLAPPEHAAALAVAGWSAAGVVADSDLAARGRLH